MFWTLKRLQIWYDQLPLRTADLRTLPRRRALRAGTRKVKATAVKVMAVKVTAAKDMAGLPAGSRMQGLWLRA